MIDLRNTWGLYNWLRTDGEQYIHPNDLERFSKYQGTCYLFQCIDVETLYITLKLKNETFKVTPEFYKPLPSPKYVSGDKVKLMNKPDDIAVIQYHMWHYDRNEPMYFISLNDKKKTKRYWESDFIPISDTIKD
jgi:hypothetical protein